MAADRSLLLALVPDTGLFTVVDEKTQLGVAQFVLNGSLLPFTSDEAYYMATLVFEAISNDPIAGHILNKHLSRIGADA